ncbi:hypothetical protein [Cupriavidus necator]
MPNSILPDDHLLTTTLFDSHAHRTRRLPDPAVRRAGQGAGGGVELPGAARPPAAPGSTVPIAPALLTPSQPSPGADASNGSANTNTIRVTLGKHHFSSHPKAIDDFSGATLLSRMHHLIETKLRNIDGPDDLAGALQLALPEVGQPFASVGVLSALFPIVALSAKSAIKHARRGYNEDYPATVRELLAQQGRMIKTLFQDGASASHLQGLIQLHQLGNERFEQRAEYRNAHHGSIRHQIAHNLRSRDKTNNAELSKLFMQEAADVVVHLAQRRQLSVETAYQGQQLEALELRRQAEKHARMAKLATAFGMSGMASGMTTSAAASSTTAASNAATNVAEQAALTAATTGVGQTTGGILIPSQLAQAASGLINTWQGHKARQQLHARQTAVEDLGHQLPPQTARQYDESTRFLLRKNAQAQFWSATLAASQTGMAATTALSMAPSIHVAATGTLAALFAGGTIAAAIGAGFVEDKLASFAGEAAPDVAKNHLRLGNLGAQLRRQGLQPVLQDLAARYQHDQQQLAKMVVWHDILKLLDRDSSPARPSDKAGQTGLQRWQALAATNEKRSSHHWLLASGQTRIQGLLAKEYDPAFLAQHPGDIHNALHQEIMAHPMALPIARTPEFQKQAMFNTVKALATLDNPKTHALFYDKNGQRVRQLDQRRFFEVLVQSPLAQTHYLRECNRLMVGQLLESQKFSRHQLYNALGDMAQTRERMASGVPFGERERTARALRR